MNPSEEEITQVVEETRTVADDILERVEQCQERLSNQEQALARLQSEGASREQVQAAANELTEARRELHSLLTEAQNTRTELRSLLESIKETIAQNSNREQNRLPDSPDSGSSTRTEPLTQVNPENGAAGNQGPETKKKRRVIR